MSKRRVAITGIGVISPGGHSLDELYSRAKAGQSSVSSHQEWRAKNDLRTHVASVVEDFDEKIIPRTFRRSMSRVAQLAYVASERALRDSGLPEDLIRHERTGIAYGSTMGGTSAIEEYFASITAEGRFASSVKTTTFLRIMSHTCAANLCTAFAIPGRIIASTTACAASTQSIGFGFEAIKHGTLDRMLCGGAEELHIAVAAVFDTLGATSAKFNDSPTQTPRPFDKDRDGIVVGEGAGTLILEDWESAKSRGAKIHGEIIGFFTNSDGSHMTNPTVEGMVRCMKGALQDAAVTAGAVDYVNAHATGTVVGDKTEARAIETVFGNRVPCSSMKGHFGHLMGAAGVVEMIASLGMMADKVILPTLNLLSPGDDCSPLNYVMGAPAKKTVEIFLKNSFAFGGINTSLVIAKA